MIQSLSNKIYYFSGGYLLGLTIIMLVGGYAIPTMVNREENIFAKEETPLVLGDGPTNFTIIDTLSFGSKAEINSIPSWQEIITWNGTIYNLSSYINVIEWNGTIFNSSAYASSFTWNGTILNTSTPDYLFSYSNIYPTSHSTGICPPCASISLTAITINGNNMNITFYSNLSGVWDYFYIGTLNTTFSNVNNGTYGLQTVFSTRYNYTYYWYAEIAEYFNETNNRTTPIYDFTTATVAENCTCNGTSIGSNISYAWIVGIAIVFSSLGILAYIRRKDIPRRRRKKNEYK